MPEFHIGKREAVRAIDQGKVKKQPVWKLMPWQSLLRGAEYECRFVRNEVRIGHNKFN